MLTRSSFDRDGGRVVEYLSSDGTWKECEFEDQAPVIMQVGGDRILRRSGQLPPVRRCDACQAPLAVLDFDGVTSQLICPECYSTTGLPQPPMYKSNMIRQRRRTANGTMAALSASVYAEIRASGPCVYCGAQAECADHVRPLARGGLDIRENLVPACRSCNSRKKDRLLSEWNTAAVARAAAISRVVAAELARLRA